MNMGFIWKISILKNLRFFCQSPHLVVALTVAVGLEVVVVDGKLLYLIVEVAGK